MVFDFEKIEVDRLSLEVLDSKLIASMEARNSVRDGGPGLG